MLSLFFPTKYFDAYHLLMIVLVSLWAWVTGFGIRREKVFFIICLFFVFIVFSSSIGFFYYQTDPIRNFSEMIRYIPLLILSFSMRENQGGADYIKIIKYAFFIYSVLCLLLSVLQVSKVGLVDGVSDLYGSTHQLEISLGLESRALGFSSGPGQNGVIMTIIFSFSLARVYLDKNKNLAIFTVIVSFFTVLFSQSQTAFLVISGVTFYSSLYAIFILKGKCRVIGINVLLVLVPVGFIGLFLMEDSLSYLFTLFSHGLERSSYQARVIKTDYLFNMTLDHPISFLFGHGKDYFGPVAGHTDNEYIFYLGVYGFSFLVLIVFIYALILSLGYLHKRNYIISSGFYLSLHFMILSGLFLAWPSAFILDPRLLFLVSLVLFLYMRERAGLVNR